MGAPTRWPASHRCGVCTIPSTESLSASPRPACGTRSARCSAPKPPHCAPISATRNKLLGAENVVDANDALTDTPIPSFYRELDTRFPGSKFIPTARDSEGWLKSRKKQFIKRFAQVKTAAYN